MIAFDTSSRWVCRPVERSAVSAMLDMVPAMAREGKRNAAVFVAK